MPPMIRKQDMIGKHTVAHAPMLPHPDIYFNPEEAVQLARLCETKKQDILHSWHFIIAHIQL